MWGHRDISLRQVLHTCFVSSLFGSLICSVFLDSDGRFGISRKCPDNDGQTRSIGSHLFRQSIAATSETLCFNEALDVLFTLSFLQCQGHS